MNIYIFIKQVPKTENLKLKAGDSFNDAGLERHLNTFDGFAIEEAIRVKDLHSNTRIVLISLGTAAAERCLIEGLSLGADKAYHVKDDLNHKKDALSTAAALAGAVKAVEKYEGPADLILTGRQSTDSSLGIVPIMLSMKLVSSVTEFSYDPEASLIHMTVRGSNSFSETSASLPLMISMTKGSHEVRFPTFKRIREANKAEIGIIDFESLDLPEPSTEVLGVIKPGRNSKNAIVKMDDDEESTLALFEMLKEDNIFAR